MAKELTQREKMQLEYCTTHCHSFRRGFYKHGDMTVPGNFGCVNSQDLTVLPGELRARYGFAGDIAVICFENGTKVCEIFSDLKKLDQM